MHQDFSGSAVSSLSIVPGSLTFKTLSNSHSGITCLRSLRVITDGTGCYVLWAICKQISSLSPNTPRHFSQKGTHSPIGYVTQMNVPYFFTPFPYLFAFLPLKTRTQGWTTASEPLIITKILAIEKKKSCTISAVMSIRLSIHEYGIRIAMIMIPCRF